MIKVQSMENSDSNDNSFKAMLFADTKNEVVSGTKIIGLPIDATLEMGSCVLTADGDVGFLKSNGEWNWVTSGGSGSVIIPSKSVTENGTYKASDDNGDGYGQVIVDVPSITGSYVDELYNAREDEYKTDSSNEPIELENYNEQTDFDEYLSTADHKTFTVLKDFLGIVSYGVRQARAGSSNIPNCSFFVNNTKVGSIDALNSTSGYESANITHMYVEFKTGDTFFWGSENDRGYAARIGAIFVIPNVDLSNYANPSWT